MKKPLILASLLLTTPISCLAQQATDDPKQVAELSEPIKLALKQINLSEKDYLASVERQKKAVAHFETLSKEQKSEFTQTMSEAMTKLKGKEKQIADALHLALEGDKIYPNNVQVLAIIGNCYVELRDMKSARETYKQSSLLTPLSPSLRFNIAEVEFVDRKYGAALVALKQAKPLLKYDRNLKTLQDLLDFKIELCHLSLSKDDSLSEEQRAEHRQFFDRAVASRNYKNPKLINYYSKAAMHFDAGEKAKAVEALKDSRFVFSNPQAHSPWIDTMMEYGYLPGLHNQKQTPGKD